MLEEGLDSLGCFEGSFILVKYLSCAFILENMRISAVGDNTASFFNQVDYKICLAKDKRSV